MRSSLLSSFAALSLALPTALCNSITCNFTCIQDSEVQGISSRWLNSFATGGIDGLANAVTDDIHIYDEGATNGSLAAYVTNYQELHDTITLGPYGGNGVQDVTYDVVFTFHTCDRIALRWQQNVITTDMIGYGSTVPAGKAISFRGTDLLTINLESKKVSNVTTSADLLEYYRDLGYDLGVWTA
ncbi:uncharacterized protein KY384_002934 [Bacidia gigantensis]|uniref:uncharacterized protein n=1 Tax=Bacidia gigantensis TaxID=2732470 RepID=UPI001D04B0EF|nr:uncharacterized protein KY384_002934 [Bacidia gigantensis]KAG8531306.1 hypothetical protein KY384_002934 [Bacidia gigantensis]